MAFFFHRLSSMAGFPPTRGVVELFAGQPTGPRVSVTHCVAVAGVALRKALCTKPMAALTDISQGGLIFPSRLPAPVSTTVLERNAL